MARSVEFKSKFETPYRYLWRRLHIYENVIVTPPYVWKFIIGKKKQIQSNKQTDEQCMEYKL